MAESGRIRVSPDRQRLIITAAISDDAGTYQCVAENRVGAVLGSATVDVPGGGANIGLIAGITGFMLLLLIALAACLVWKTKQQKVGRDGRWEMLGRGDEVRMWGALLALGYGRGWVLEVMESECGTPCSLWAMGEVGSRGQGVRM